MSKQSVPYSQAVSFESENFIPFPRRREESFIKLYVAAPIQTAAISIKANNTVSIISYPADKHLLLLNCSIKSDGHSEKLCSR